MAAQPKCVMHLFSKSLQPSVAHDNFWGRGSGDTDSLWYFTDSLAESAAKWVLTVYSCPRPSFCRLRPCFKSSVMHVLDQMLSAQHELGTVQMFFSGKDFWPAVGCSAQCPQLNMYHSSLTIPLALIADKQNCSDQFGWTPEFWAGWKPSKRPCQTAWLQHLWLPLYSLSMVLSRRIMVPT